MTIMWSRVMYIIIRVVLLIVNSWLLVLKSYYLNMSYQLNLNLLSFKNVSLF